MIVTLFGKSVFAEVIKLRILRIRLSCIRQVGPKSNDKCSYKRKTKGDLRKKRRRPCEDGGRNWRDAATSHEMPETTRNEKRQGRILPWKLWRECGPVDTLISDFWPPELREDKFVVLSHPLCGNLLW